MHPGGTPNSQPQTKAGSVLLLAVGSGLENQSTEVGLTPMARHHQFAHPNRTKRLRDLGKPEISNPEAKEGRGLQTDTILSSDVHGAEQRNRTRQTIRPPK